jgi:hypothetical protein
VVAAVVVAAAVVEVAAEEGAVAGLQGRSH